MVIVVVIWIVVCKWQLALFSGAFLGSGIDVESAAVSLPERCRTGGGFYRQQGEQHV